MSAETETKCNHQFSLECSRSPSIPILNRTRTDSPLLRSVRSKKRNKWRSRSCSQNDVDNDCSDDEFTVDTQPDDHTAAPVATPPHNAIVPTNEPFDRIALHEIRADLHKSTILHHGLCKVYSRSQLVYVDVAAVLTANYLYFLSAKKYQIWQELRERTLIDDYIDLEQASTFNINQDLARLLINNLDILPADENERLLPYFVGKTRNDIMLSVLLSNYSGHESGHDNTYKLSSYFRFESSSSPFSPSKTIKMIEITNYFDTKILPNKQMSEFLEFLMSDIEHVKEEQVGHSLVITLDKYHYDDILFQLSEQKTQYFREHGLLHERRVQIREYVRPLTELAETRVKLSAFRRVTPGAVSADSARSTSNTGNVAFCARYENEKYEWIAHLDYALWQKRTNEQTENDEKDDISTDEDGEDDDDEKEEPHSVRDLHIAIDINAEDINVIQSYEPTKQRFNNNFSDESDDDTKDDEYVRDFNFGEYLNYWEPGYRNSVAPKYPTLKNELLRNKIATLSEADYYELYEQCVKLYKQRGFKIRAHAVGENNHHRCGIPENAALTINHLIALKIYTDYTNTQNLFKRNCRRLNEREGTHQFTQRNSEIAHWCRYLMEAVMFYGTMMNMRQKLYTGLNQKLIFASFIQHFYCPLSTTQSLTIAEKYRDDEGVILKLKAADSKCRYFDVSWLSRYKFENERLIMGAALKISNIMVHTAENLQMRAFILAFHLLEHILEGYEFNATIEAEEELYKMLVITFSLRDEQVTNTNYRIPPYVQQLLDKQISNMEQKRLRRKLWINNDAIQKLRNKKLKCLFDRKGERHTKNEHRNDDEKESVCPTKEMKQKPVLKSKVKEHARVIRCDCRCGIQHTHRCGEFFYHYKIDINEVHSVTRFEWRLSDAELRNIKSMDACKSIQSGLYEHVISRQHNVQFFLTFYPRFTRESKKCALFIHLHSMPDDIEYIKIGYHLLCEYGARKNYEQVMVPHVLNMHHKQYCGCQAFASAKLQAAPRVIWNIAIKVFEVKYHRDLDVADHEENKQDLDELDSLSKRALIDRVKRMNNELERNQSEVLRLKLENERLRLQLLSDAEQ